MAANKSTTITPFLGKAVEIYIVTKDCNKTIAGLQSLGIGPFQKYYFDSDTITNCTYRGQPSDFELLVAFATRGDIVWEIIQPVHGELIMQEFLDKGGEGIQHVAFDCQDVPQHARRAEFEKREYPLVQLGIWYGKKGICEFMFSIRGGLLGRVLNLIRSRTIGNPQRKRCNSS